MEQLIELLKQIQELAGAGIDALEGASSEQAGDTGGEQPQESAEGQAPGGPPPA